MLRECFGGAGLGALLIIWTHTAIDFPWSLLSWPIGIGSAERRCAGHVRIFCLGQAEIGGCMVSVRPTRLDSSQRGLGASCSLPHLFLCGHVSTIEASAVKGDRRRRRRHTVEFKANLIAACSRPGVSIASVALANGINANLLRRWIEQGGQRLPSADLGDTNVDMPRHHA